MTSATAPPAPSRGLFRRAVVETGYLLLGLPLAVVGFVVAVTTVSVSAALLVVALLGLVTLAGGLAGAELLGNVEGLRLVAVGHPLPAPRPFRTDQRGVGWVKDRLRHRQGWLDLLFQLLNFPLATLSFVVVITWWSVGLAGLTFPLYEWAIPDGDRGVDYLLAQWGVDSLAAEYGVTVLLGLVLVLTAPWVVRGLVAMHYAWARITLGGASRAELEERVASLTRSRAAVVDAESDTLRRIERDIHDGPQQRLVRLSMDLEAAQRRLTEGDAEATRALLADGLEHVQGSLAELRALSRGIAPPILTDRGLRAAVISAAGQCPVPVETDIALSPGQRLASARESAAYFVVTRALVRLGVDDDGVLHVLVRDEAAAVRTRAGDTGWPACATGSPASTAGSTCTAPTAREPSCGPARAHFPASAPFPATAHFPASAPFPATAHFSATAHFPASAPFPATAHFSATAHFPAT